MHQRRGADGSGEMWDHTDEVCFAERRDLGPLGDAADIRQSAANIVDGVVFDHKLKQIFTSNGGDATLSVVQEVSENKFTKLADIPTKKGARTLDIDQKTHKIYLPTAEYQPLQAGEKRPKMVAGSFQVIVVEKQ